MRWFILCSSAQFSLRTVNRQVRLPLSYGRRRPPVAWKPSRGVGYDLVFLG
jgi:hypothetical protein